MDLTPVSILTLLASVLTPFITALFTKPDTPSSTKRLIAAVVSVVLGTLVAIVTGQVTWANNAIYGLASVPIIIGIVMALAQGFYLQLKDFVGQIESAAHPGPTAPEALEEAEPDVIPESVWDENLPPDEYADDLEEDEDTDPVEQDLEPMPKA